MSLSFRHLVSTQKVEKADISHIFQVSREMEEVLMRRGDQRLQGYILANLFYEPSTRTRFSFAVAMHRLGGQVISAEGIQFSSLYKGESLEDTIRVVGQYADIICMRHPEQGSAARAAVVSSVPFINGGDGPGEHPTQALLDLYTIEKEQGTLEGVRVALVGDLHYGRTVHSLSFLLSLYPGVQCIFVSPVELRIPDSVRDFLTARGVRYTETDSLIEGLQADVLYMTRIQKERFQDQRAYEKLKSAYVLHAADVKGRRTTILHPLPRVGEVASDVDDLPNAAYFRQVRNGIVVRMALLTLLLGKA